MRIAHISDLHVARSPAFSELNPKRFLGYVNTCLFRGRLYRERVAARALAGLMENPPDLMILTGDMTQHGLASEFDAAGELLRPVTKGGVPVIAVPGNHDIYGQAGHDRLRRFLDDLRFGAQPDRHGIFHFGGVDVLPLSQAVSTPLLFSHGRQDSGELRLAEEAWAERAPGAMRLACGHYPVVDAHHGRFSYFRCLRDAAKLAAFFRACRVAGYFCGHDHRRFSAAVPGGCVQYAAPALSSVRNAGGEWISVYVCGPELASPVDERLGAG